MTGLEKIVAQITDESSEKVNSIMLSAKEEARRIVTEKREEAAREAERISQNAEEEAQRIISTAKTGADALTRTKYLEVKNAVVNDVIAAAFEAISAFDDEKYFRFLIELLKKHIEPGQCTMVLSQSDLQRLPAGFEEKINGEVYETAAVSVSRTPGRLSSGFILVYPDFEINCSIKSLIEERMDEIKDRLCASLFD